MHYPFPTWRDFVSRLVWFLAIGWCATKTLVGVAQGYKQIALYRNVLIPEEDVEEVLRESVKKPASTLDEVEGASGIFNDDSGLYVE
jgi:hypothetical protein